MAEARHPLRELMYQVSDLLFESTGLLDDVVEPAVGFLIGLELGLHLGQTHPDVALRLAQGLSVGQPLVVIEDRARVAETIAGAVAAMPA